MKKYNDLEKRTFIFDTDRNKLIDITKNKFEIIEKDGVKTLYVNDEYKGGIFEKNIEIPKPLFGVCDTYILITTAY